jgi:hypothetical protein
MEKVLKRRHQKMQRKRTLKKMIKKLEREERELMIKDRMMKS